PGYAARYAVRPGLIGWAQLRAPLGEISASPRRELEHDLFYVKHSSIRLDARILMAASARLANGVAAATEGSLRSSLQPAIDAVASVVTRPLDQRGFPGWRRPPIDPALQT